MKISHLFVGIALGFLLESLFASPPISMTDGYLVLVPLLIGYGLLWLKEK